MPADGFILELHLDPEDARSFLCDIALEPREEGHHDNDFEILFFLVSQKDPVSQLLRNHVLMRHEELVLDVNELLRLFYQNEVGVVNRVLHFVYASAPLA